jgi:hypothetical protein
MQVTVPVPFNLSEDFRPLVVPEYQPPEPFHAQPAPPRKPKGFLNKEQREWQEIHERNHREVQVRERESVCVCVCVCVGVGVCCSHPTKCALCPRWAATAVEGLSEGCCLRSKESCSPCGTGLQKPTNGSLLA